MDEFSKGIMAIHDKYKKMLQDLRAGTLMSASTPYAYGMLLGKEEILKGVVDDLWKELSEHGKIR